MLKSTHCYISFESHWNSKVTSSNIFYHYIYTEEHCCHGYQPRIQFWLIFWLIFWEKMTLLERILKEFYSIDTIYVIHICKRPKNHQHIRERKKLYISNVFKVDPKLSGQILRENCCFSAYFPVCARNLPIMHPI